MSKKEITKYTDTKYTEDAWSKRADSSKNNPFDNKFSAWGWEPEYRQNIIDWTLSIPDVKSLLDIGCNQGQYLYELHKRSLNAKLVGIDITPECIETAKNNCKKQEIEFDTGDARNLLFRDRQFHTVLFLNVLMHMPDPIEVIKEAARVANTYLIVSSYGSKSKRYHTHGRKFLNWRYTKNDVLGFIEHSDGEWDLEGFAEFENPDGSLIFQYKFKRIN